MRAKCLRVAALFALAITGTTLTPGLATGALPGRDGVLAYEGNGAYDQQGHPKGRAIWALNPVTGAQRQLTFPEQSAPGDGGEIAVDTEPAFSPSGNSLAFVRSRQITPTRPQSVIYLAQADGTDPQEITEGESPSFSPGGNYLVFVRHGDLYITTAVAGARPSRLTNGYHDAQPQWSNTGRIVFVRKSAVKVRILRPPHQGLYDFAVTRYDVRVLSPWTRHVHRVLSLFDDVGDLEPDWSPSGQRLLVGICWSDVIQTPLPAQALLHMRIFASRPTVVFRSSCHTVRWTPEGRIVEAPTPARGTSVPTTCPSETGRFAWQPVHNTTMLVPTSPCVPVTLTAVEAPPRAAVVGEETKVCFYSRRRHRRVCVETSYR